MAYPSGVRIYIDDVDMTSWIFGEDEITIDDAHNIFEDIDISSLVPDVGRHKIVITCTAGVGRVEARLELD